MVGIRLARRLRFDLGLVKGFKGRCNDLRLDRIGDVSVAGMRMLVDMQEPIASAVPFKARLPASRCRVPRARARARRVVPISELVFGALTQNRRGLEDRTTTRRCHRASGRRRVSI
jgi:hypothetical protein